MRSLKMKQSARRGLSKLDGTLGLTSSEKHTDHIHRARVHKMHVAVLQELSAATRVCSAHFAKTDFTKTLSGRTRLKPEAVPSVFNWTAKTPKRRSPRKRSCTISTAPGPSMQPCSSKEDTAHSIEIPASADHDYCSPPLPPEDKLEAAQVEIERLQQEVLDLKGKTFFLERFSSDPQTIAFYTGFKNYETLKCVFLALQPTAATMIRWTQMQRHSTNTDRIRIGVFSDTSLPLIDQFFMFLCRVRQGFPEQDLALRFGVSQSTVSRLLITWANYLYIMFGSLEIWPSRQIVDRNMPECFKKTFAKCRVIIDCTEVKVQTPTSKVLNSEIYSNYKSHSTFKGLIGITPCGVVSFVSSLYTGSISDKEITERSGILDLLEPFDEVMADKGFLIEDLLSDKQVSLVIPPFLGQKGKFTADEVSRTHEIARLRIHVERAIRRIKEYHLFDGIIPLTLAASVNQIWTVCAILSNFYGPLY